jgi:Uma2 family endonuclease
MPGLTVELPSQQSLTEQNLRRWTELMSDSRLQQLDARVETDRFGRIIMSPTPSAHYGSYQFKIGLAQPMHARGLSCYRMPNLDRRRRKAADVAWACPNVCANRASILFPRAPEICVEILSPSNAEAEIREKTALYFDAGAVEVWHCTTTGKIIFFRAAARSNSQLWSRFSGSSEPVIQHFTQPH